MTSSAYNDLNQVTSVSGTGLLSVSGSLSQSGTNLSEPGTVTAGGKVVSTDSNGNFTVQVPVVAGSNNIPILAASTGTSNNVTSGTLGVNVTSGAAIPSLGYDANGNLTSDGTRTYTWDAANRLVGVAELSGSSSQFAYDGLGRRVQIIESSSGTVTSTKNLIWDGMTIREERNASNGVTKMYFGNGVQIGGTNYYYTRDHLGSIREMTTGTNAAIQAQYDYDPYGQQTELSGTMSADFGFTGLYVHQPSGLNLAPYRGYSSGFGRWISRDPSGERGGINLYEYVLNDPIYYFDPTGFGPVPHLNGQPSTQAQWNQAVTNTINTSAAIAAAAAALFGDDLLPDSGPPADQPKPPGWNDDWEWRCPAKGNGGPRWFDPDGGEWRYHPEDQYHNPHWDYNPWDQWNSPWQNQPIPPNPPLK